MVPRRLPGFRSPYLVHRLAIYNRLRQPGLVEDFTRLDNLAILSRPGTEMTG
ncbi:MAG: hypothetical protein JW732_09310 [Dehalococcoidia bacterium]|nr:hypothetical protein [Dehalococcoidia bacterium]